MDNEESYLINSFLVDNTIVSKGDFASVLFWGGMSGNDCGIHSIHTHCAIAIAPL
ncbi:hypothetical protein [Nostoc sp.]|uniref:hypothetical protein n=1 Tax=Nostoc sp. TaxID=1180 RepID=UPI002FFB5481